MRHLCYLVRMIATAPGRQAARCLRQQEGVDRPRKPLPRKKIPADLRSLARGHTALCIKVLAGIVSQEAMPPAARVTAAGILLDRGWGRAPQPHTGEDGKDIRVVIRQITEETEAGAVPGGARASVSAPSALLDKGWGRAPQVHSGEDASSIQVGIREISDEEGLLLIEHETLEK